MPHKQCWIYAKNKYFMNFHVVWIRPLESTVIRSYPVMLQSDNFQKKIIHLEEQHWECRVGQYIGWHAWWFLFPILSLSLAVSNQWRWMSAVALLNWSTNNQQGHTQSEKKQFMICLSQVHIPDTKTHAHPLLHNSVKSFEISNLRNPISSNLIKLFQTIIFSICDFWQPR